jgi:hypothetical protein
MYIRRDTLPYTPGCKGTSCRQYERRANQKIGVLQGGVGVRKNFSESGKTIIGHECLGGAHLSAQREFSYRKGRPSEFPFREHHEAPSEEKMAATKDTPRTGIIVVCVPLLLETIAVPYIRDG